MEQPVDAKADSLSFQCEVTGREPSTAAAASHVPFLDSKRIVISEGVKLPLVYQHRNDQI